MVKWLKYVQVKKNQKGLILNLGPKWVSAVALSSDSKIKPGQFVFLTHELMSIPVGDSLLGRVVNPLGEPIDYKGNIITKTKKFIRSESPFYYSKITC